MSSMRSPSGADPGIFLLVGGRGEEREGGPKFGSGRTAELLNE